MGNRPLDIFLLCDFEDIPATKALSIQLLSNGITSLHVDDFDDKVLDLCQAVAVCVGENTRSLSSKICDALERQLNLGAFQVIVIFLSSGYKEDSIWLPANWVELKTENDPVALLDLVAMIRPPLQVFLCHCTTDKLAVRELYAFLMSEGFRPWLDEKDLIAGQDWELAIQNAVRTSQVVIVFLSRAAATKVGFIQKEIRLALDAADEQPEGSIFLITARLEDCVVPSRLRKWQWVDLWEPDGYQRVLQALKLRARELALRVACGLTTAEVAHLATWRPVPPGRTVLIIDGNRDLLRYVTNVLEKKDWTVMSAETAGAAIDLMRMDQKAPTIALIGHYLPDVNGWAFGIKLREQSPTMGIIITSNDEPTHEEEVSCEENDFYFLGKPFLAAELLRVLNQIRGEQMRKRRQ